MNKKFITIVVLFCILPFKVLSQDIDDEIVTDTLTLEESDMYDHFLQIDYALRDTSERTMPICRLPPASTTPFSHSKVYTTNNGNITSCILIIVSDDICEYPSLLKRIIRYANDLYYALQRDVVIEKVVAEDYTDIKQLIKGYYYNNGLIGVTLIGNINYASYHQVYKVWNDNLKKEFLKQKLGLVICIIWIWTETGLIRMEIEYLMNTKVK